MTQVRGQGAAGLRPGWQAAGSGLPDPETGAILIPAEATPAVARVCAVGEKVELRRPGAPAITLDGKRCADVAVLPGAPGPLVVTDRQGRPVARARVHVLPFGRVPFRGAAGLSLIVPQVAHLPGMDGAFWRTDLALINPSGCELRLSLRLLRPDTDHSLPAVATMRLPAGAAVVVPDLLTLPEFAGTKLAGLLIQAVPAGGPCAEPKCGLLAYARTFNRTVMAAAWAPGEWLPGVPAGSGLLNGSAATFSGITNDQAARASVGLASLSARPVRVRIRVFTGAGQMVEDRELEVPPKGHLHSALQATVVGGRVEVEAVGAAPSGSLFPYASLVDQASGRSTNLLPDSLRAPDRATPADPSQRPAGAPNGS